MSGKPSNAGRSSRLWLAGQALQWLLIPKESVSASDEQLGAEAPPAAWKTWKRKRAELLKSKATVKLVGLHVPLPGEELRTLTVQQIARQASSFPAKARMLMGLARATSPHTILELGTILGLGTLVLSLCAPNAAVHSIELENELLDRARMTVAGLAATLHQGRFEDVLPRLLPQIAPIDLLFIDGHHNPTALHRYLLGIKPHLSNDAWVVVDDIRWSKPMWQAWQELAKDVEGWPVALDSFYWGILKPKGAVRHGRLSPLKKA